MEHREIKFLPQVEVCMILELILIALNKYVIHSILFGNIAVALPGLIFLISPVYPEYMKKNYGDVISKIVVRVIAIIVIIAAFKLS